MPLSRSSLLLLFWDVDVVKYPEEAACSTSVPGLGLARILDSLGNSVTTAREAKGLFALDKEQAVEIEAELAGKGIKIVSPDHNLQCVHECLESGVS